MLAAVVGLAGPAPASDEEVVSNTSSSPLFSPGGMLQMEQLDPPPFSNIRGPGQARRAPPCTPFRFAGSVLQRTIEYDANGKAILHLRAVRSDESTTLLVSSSGDGGGGHDSPNNTPPSGGPASSNALPMSTVEQREAADQEAQFSGFMNSYPLFRVLPPRTVEEQRYSLSPGGTGHPPAQPSSVGVMLQSTLPPAEDETPGRHQQQQQLSLHGATVVEGAGAAPTVVSIGQSCDDSNTLRALTWGGCRPASLRPVTWRLLADYAPPTMARQLVELSRKRGQYRDYVRQYWRTDGYKPRQSTGSSFIPNASATASGATTSTVAASAGGRRLPSYLPPTVGNVGTSGGGMEDRLTAAAMMAPHEEAILRQIALDLPRHRAPVFHCTRTASSLARCLFLWSQRHPAVGYVQGIDDFVAVFYHVFLVDALRQMSSRREAEMIAAAPGSDSSDATKEKFIMQVMVMGTYTGHDLEGSRHIDEPAIADWSREELSRALDTLPEDVLIQVEADTYWCAGRLLSYLQDNFTHGQSGIMKCAKQVEAVLRVDNPALWKLLENCGIGVLDACFQWFHCLLARELPLSLLLQLWDTYLAIGGEEVLNVHVFVCTAIILSLRERLTGAAMDVAMITLRDPVAALFPKGDGKDGEARTKAQNEWLSVVLADAYRLWRQHPHLVSRN